MRRVVRVTGGAGRCSTLMFAPCETVCKDLCWASLDAFLPGLRCFLKCKYLHCSLIPLPFFVDVFFFTVPLQTGHNICLKIFQSLVSKSIFIHPACVDFLLFFFYKCSFMMDLAEPHMSCWLPGATVTGTVIDQWLILPDAHIYTTATLSLTWSTFAFDCEINNHSSEIRNTFQILMMVTRARQNQVFFPSLEYMTFTCRSQCCETISCINHNMIFHKTE